MKILAIETSCDETSAAVLEAKKSQIKILSDIVSSQVKLHAKYGGVHPSLAKREHQKNLPTVFKKALKEAENPEIDAIAVTIGPGLEPCLWVGVNFVEELAKKLKKPIIPVSHIEAHIMANWAEPIRKIQNIFPAICLVVSGGHTQLILMKGIGRYKILGETRDDAAGECFDKIARILGLGYPGGPLVAAEAKKYNMRYAEYQIRLPRPMIGQKNYDFSFSGLKTAVLYDFRSRSPKVKKSKKYIQEMCFEAQQAIIDVLIKKTIKAVKDFKVKSIILGGGVVASEELRKQFQSAIDNKQLAIKFLVPPKNLCTDNAAMVAIAAYFRWKKRKKKNREKITANANLRLGI